MEDERIYIISMAAGNARKVLVAIETKNAGTSALSAVHRSLKRAAVCQRVYHLNGVDEITSTHPYGRHYCTLRDISVRKCGSAPSSRNTGLL